MNVSKRAQHCMVPLVIGQSIIKELVSHYDKPIHHSFWTRSFVLLLKAMDSWRLKSQALREFKTESDQAVFSVECSTTC